MKDGAKTYDYLKRYYDMEWDTRVYGSTQLVDLLGLELRYN